MKLGLIGEKLGHSYSPLIHGVIFELLGIKGEYKLIELKRDELGNFVKYAANQGYAGLNVTIPYKTDVIPFMQELSGEAKKIGAVNTISLKNGLKGFNTDYFGIKYTFIKSGVNVNGKKILITGSGGASKSVIAYLLDENAGKIFIASRNPGKITAENETVIPVGYDNIMRYTPFDIIINTTPVGMFPNAGVSPLESGHIKGAEFLFDLIYNPARTELMRLSDELGIKNVNGLYMLVAQAVKAHEIWNEKTHAPYFTDSVYDRVAELLK
mgnify:CR=1 FL=1